MIYCKSVIGRKKCVTQNYVGLCCIKPFKMATNMHLCPVSEQAIIILIGHYYLDLVTTCLWTANKRKAAGHILLVKARRRTFSCYKRSTCSNTGENINFGIVYCKTLEYSRKMRIQSKMHKDQIRKKYNGQFYQCSWLAKKCLLLLQLKHYLSIHFPRYFFSLSKIIN